jgi:hypothetical protein
MYEKQTVIGLRLECFGPGLGLALAVLVACGGMASAQEDPRAKELETLRTTVQQLEKALQDVRAKLAEMERKERLAPETNAPAAKAAAPAATASPAGSNRLIIAEQRIDLPAPTVPLDAYGRSPIPDYDTFNDQQQAAPRPDNKPIDPALKGFIPIPGTKSMIRFGGSARLDAIYDFEDNGNPNQFVPSSIPVEGQAGADGGPRSTIHAKGTRIGFEVRRPAGEEGTLRIFNENDFFNDSTSSSMSFRVRHFYGQAWNFLVGQTYTAFMDIDAWPDVLDYAGPNAMINRRQPQIRYSPPIYDGVGKMHLLFSLEQPDSDLSTTATGLPAGAKTVTRAPDGVAGWRWEGKVGHVQLAGLFRSIGYEADNAPDQEVFGWGVNAAGAFNLFATDKLTWQVAYGEGMARYVNDLGGADLDAAPDSSGNLKALPVFATTAGYTHQWSPHFRSTASYGYVRARPKTSLGAFAIDDTHYASANLVWHPTKFFRMGLEYLYGLKETQGGADGDGHRLNFVLRYDLIR